MQQDRSFEDLRAIVARRTPIVLVLCLLGALAGFAYSSTRRTAYRATAATVVNLQDVPPSGIGGIQAANVVNPNVYAATDAHVASSPAVAGLALRLSGISGTTVSGLLNESSVAADINANYLHFAVTTRTPSRSIALVNALARAFLQFQRKQDIRQTAALLRNVNGELRSVSARLQAPGHRSRALQVALIQQYGALATQQAQLRTLKTYQAHQSLAVTNPATGASPTGVTRKIAVGMGVAAGLLVGILLAFALEGADTRIRALDELSRLGGTELLGKIPRARHKGRQAVCLTGTTSMPVVDAYYGAAARLVRALEDHQGTVAAVTSAVEGEGTSAAACNLALALAALGQRVTVVDLDLRRSTVWSLLGIRSAPGVVEIAAGTVDLDEALQTLAAPTSEWSTGSPHLHRLDGELRALVAGEMPRDAGTLVASARVGEIVSSVRDVSDVVLVATGPLLAAADTLSVLPLVDGVVLVSRLNQTTRPNLLEARNTLAMERAVVLGMVVTGCRRSDVHPGGVAYVASTREKQRAFPGGGS